MVLEFFRSPDDTGLDHVEAQIASMLADCRHTFDAAMNALLGGARADIVNEDVRTTDQGINESERTIRRELVVHASIHGSQDVSTILAYLLVSRMLERVGDNAKNILDLALEGIDLSDADDAEATLAFRDEISSMFASIGTVLSERDTDAATTLIDRSEELLGEFDELVVGQINSEDSARQAVPRALLYRYLKRIVANLANVLTSVVLPVDQMDYYGDEDDDS